MKDESIKFCHTKKKVSNITQFVCLFEHPTPTTVVDGIGGGGCSCEDDT